ncbi:unnamed protein product [Polarella glacialis]|uniref:Glucosamine/galactosamine-6-phosphate isomerase domain-containing protein n=1 Tax=Polarella glacialis TaxID=89957 RepID=A0A813GCR8_POLGL|nr:unnamed protein product [Polarella glacialis]
MDLQLAVPLPLAFRSHRTTLHRDPCRPAVGAAPASEPWLLVQRRAGRSQLWSLAGASSNNNTNNNKNDKNNISTTTAVAAAAVGLAAQRCRGRTRRLLRCQAEPEKSAAGIPAAVGVPDGRSFRVFEDDAAVGDYICARVSELAMSAIASKGAFSMSIGSGTTVAPLQALKSSGDVDFSRVHIFFGNDRTTGDNSGKCFEGAKAFTEACGIPPENVHPIGSGEPAAVAERYEALIRDMPSQVVGRCERNGFPALDLVLLGTGADGHTASLYPDSSQVLQSPCSRLIVPAEGKGGVTASIDYFQSARNVILSATKASQAEMVALALGNAHAASNTQCPAGMISAGTGTNVQWLVSKSSVSLLLGSS